LEEEKLSKRDMEVLIKWLTRDCGVVVTSNDVSSYLPEIEGELIIQMVKILSEGESAQDHPITEADKGTVTIRDTLNKLDIQVESIEKQIEK
jgi:charged multivesicular body protein 7